METSSRRREVLFLFVVLLAVALLAQFRARGPEPLGTGAPAGSFSAARALGELRNLLGGEGIPHPIGSAEHDRVRDRIVARLRQLGYAPEVRRDFACSPYGSCGSVDNITAELPGRESGKPLLLAMHYDSQPAAPGASDDGAGVAAFLEIARALKAQPPRHPVLFLIDDGEETALLGAEAFVKHDPRAKNLSAVVNVEARGTAGLVHMFETSHGNESLIARLAESGATLSTSSLFYEVYEQLPNDTDVTVFKRAGLQALNFANIGNVAGYHTRLDTLANASPRTMQQRGDDLLAVTRSLSERGVDPRPERQRRNAVYFDVLNFFVVRWPAPWTAIFAVLNLFAVALAAVALLRGNGLPDAARGVATIVAALVLAAMLGFGLARLLDVAYWLAHPAPAVLASVLFGLLAALSAATLLLRNARPGAVVSGLGIAWALLALGTSVVSPEVAFLLLVPSIALTVVCLIFAFRPAEPPVGWLVLPALAVALLTFPLAPMFYDALGQQALFINLVLFALMATTYAPVVALAGSGARKVALIAVAVVAVGSLATAIALPAQTPASPRQLNLTLVTDGNSGTSRVVTGSLTAALDKAAPWSKEPEPVYPWSKEGAAAFTTPSGIKTVSPTIELLSDLPNGKGRTIALRVRSLRGAPRVGIALHSDAAVTEIVVNGWRVEREVARRDEGRYAAGWTRVNASMPVPAEATFVVTLAGKQQWQAYGLDVTYDLAEPALVKARNAEAIPVHDGDTTVIYRKLE